MFPHLYSNIYFSVSVVHLKAMDFLLNGYLGHRVPFDLLLIRFTEGTVYLLIQFVCYTSPPPVICDVRVYSLNH